MKYLILVVLIFAANSNLHAKTVVVVHLDNTATISAKDVERLFLGKDRKFSTGQESIPVNQKAGNGPRTLFDDEILGRSTAQVSAYWSKLVFTGKGIPPKEVDGDTAVIELVKNNKNVIGYIHSDSITPDVKVLTLN